MSFTLLLEKLTLNHTKTLIPPINFDSMRSSKHAFWQALVFTIIVFIIGLILGFFLESNRAEKVEIALINSEINLLDEQIRNRGIEQFNIECELAKESTIAFADSIYKEALKLEKYDATSKFSDTLRTLHKRYDLLRMLLWIEGIKLKENCAEEIHTAVYFFQYASEEVEIEAKQSALSRLLLDLKNKHGSQILLIPIAGNLELKSIDLVLKKYGSFAPPVIIIDEEKVITKPITFDQLESIIFEKPGFKNLEGVVFEKVIIHKILDSEDKIYLN
jgi:hypothetical protein